MGRSRYKMLIPGKQPYFLTSTVFNWIPIFGQEAIMNEDMLNQKPDYIHYNPVRKGYVDDPSYWRYSSFNNTMGQKGLLPIEIIC